MDQELAHGFFCLCSLGFFLGNRLLWSTFKKLLFLLEGRRVTSECLTVKLAVVGRGSCGLSYKVPSVYTDCAASPPTDTHLSLILATSGKDWIFSEKLNVSYSTVRLVHVKFWATISEHC